MKWSIAGALVLGAVGVLAVPKPAEALPVQRLEITYYSNAAMTSWWLLRAGTLVATSRDTACVGRQRRGALVRSHAQLWSSPW